MIRLSLIIATYNRARPLLEALESVVAQDAPLALWECVVVNNNSQDDTEARFADFAARHPAFALRMVREPHQGLSHARNCGIAAARGEYLAIIDDDERINPGFVAAYIRFFDTHPDAVAAGGASYLSIRPGGRRGCRATWSARWPTRSTWATGCVSSPRAASPGAATWPCAARPWSATVASTRRWAAWAGV